jgi:hypothetical protein
MSKVKIQVFVEEKTKDKLINDGKKQNRSLSNLAGTILDESVKEKK